MSKKQFKSQANSGRVANNSSSAFGGFTSSQAFGVTSILSHITEPADLSAISDPSIVVTFKNLTKKDATTKAKALEELQTYVLAHTVEAGAVEDGLLEVWIKWYPRTSIDSSRRVRQLAHILQGQISMACGKRMAKHMPVVVGAWLAGLFDNDRLVARAAQESFRQVFPTPEKTQNLWKAFKRAILEYCRDAILRETAQTLSDERSVSPDDAEAKRARVLGTGISVLFKLIEEVSGEILDRESELLHVILGDKKLWENSSHKDAYVRRSVYKLLTIMIARKPDYVVGLVKLLSIEMLYKGLIAEQSGSAWDYAMTLAALTSSNPNIWTDAYSGKKSALERLQRFLRKGSQGGPPSVWDEIRKLLNRIPASVFPSSLPQSQDLLESLHEGVVHKDEARSNVLASWTCYVALFDLIHERQSSADRLVLIRECMIPIVHQYIRPSAEKSNWATGARSIEVCTAAMRSISQTQTQNPTIGAFIEEEWSEMANQLIAQMKTSAPEQSKDFARSQKALAAGGQRLVTLSVELWKDPRIQLDDLMTKTIRTITEGSVDVLRARIGKPYGVASILAYCLQRSPDAIKGSTETMSIVSDFLIQDLSNLVDSPSFPELCLTLGVLGKDPAHERLFVQAFQATARAILRIDDFGRKTQALQTLLAHLPLNTPELMTDDVIDAFIKKTFQDAMHGTVESWSLVGTALATKGIIKPTTVVDILSEMVQGLKIEDQALSALEGLDLIVASHGTILQELGNKAELLSNLLALTEVSDETLATHAETTNASIESLLSGHHGDDLTDSVVTIIEQGLTRPDQNSISIPSLVERAIVLLRKPGADTDSLILRLLPGVECWEEALKPFLEIQPVPGLAITDILGGSLYLAVGCGPSKAMSCARDASGWSAALRMGVYVTQLREVYGAIFENVGVEQRARLLQSLLLTLQLTNDQLDHPDANHIFLRQEMVRDEDVQDFIAGAHRIINEVSIGPSTTANEKLVDSLRLNLRSAMGDRTASAFYHARAFAHLVDTLTEQGLGLSKTQLASMQDEFRAMRKTKETLFEATALLIGFRDSIAASKAANRMCNELISDLTGLRYSKESEEPLRQLVLLNSIILHQPVLSDIHQPRLVALIKNLLSWIDHQLLQDFRPTAEVIKALIVLLPAIETVYGSHWTLAVQIIDSIWRGLGTIEAPLLRLPAIHASLKLFIALKKIHLANDDIEEAWSQMGWLEGMVTMLKSMPDDISDESNLPLKLVNELLARQVADFPDQPVAESNELYGLIYSESASIQQTAFTLLHRLIPKTQEEISVETALSKTTAKLPEELLSLILEAPTLAGLEDASWDGSMPLSLRGYLLSWILIFDHFSTSSYKVKSDYIASLKQGAYLPSLLSFTTDFLGHTIGKSVDATRFSIQTYTPESSPSSPPERDAQHLLTHLYYLSLTHLPSLSKSWYLDITSRQASLSLSSWTEKYISPLIIRNELSTVSEWTAAGQSTSSFSNSDDDTKLQIRVSQSTKEVSAGYEVDEQMMQIVIRLPPMYPLRQATVESVHRVGVTEKKWQSWLINTQGVIQFSNGSIIDGLTAWRRNVQGAMKGQSECAICYSIISADKQLPNKRCATCKNLFHSACLFRWFKSSNGSSCPLCRNAFSYG